MPRLSSEAGASDLASLSVTKTFSIFLAFGLRRVYREKWQKRQGSPNGETVDTTPERDEADRLLPPRKLVALFGVSSQSLRNWHAAGLLAAQRTAGGHRRYRESEVRALVAELQAVA